MARGFQKIKQIAAESQAKKEAYDTGDGDFQRALVLKPGQVARGRFCEEGEGVVMAYVHDLPKKAGQSIADKILCIDQDDLLVPCWCCQNGIKRSARLVMNFIRYDEPKLLRDAQGKAIKDNFNNYQFEMVQGPNGIMVPATEMALLVFTTGSGAAGRLSFLEDQKGGITRHVCTIARTTDNTNPYMIDIAEENKVPPSPQEVELFNKKVDPLKAITLLGKRSIPAKSYNEMPALYGSAPASGFAQDSSGFAQPVNPENNVYAQQAAAASAKTGINDSAFS